MNLSLSKEKLKQYIGTQLEHFYPDQYKFKGKEIDHSFDIALERLDYCFKHIARPAYSDNKGNTFFSHLHSDQYSQFLYFLSNSLWKYTGEEHPICSKLILLNRALHGIWYSYKGALPDIFYLTHPVGSVLGNASYSDYLVVLQNVTVNTGISTEESPKPILGKGLFLGAGAKIIGNQTIGDRVSIGCDAIVYDKEIKSDSVVIRDETGRIQIRPRKNETCMAQNYFNVEI